MANYNAKQKASKLCVCVWDELRARNEGKEWKYREYSCAISSRNDKGGENGNASKALKTRKPRTDVYEKHWKRNPTFQPQHIIKQTDRVGGQKWATQPKSMTARPTAVRAKLLQTNTVRKNTFLRRGKFKTSGAN